MLPFGETVTLYRKSDNVWKPTVLSGCSWIDSTRRMTLSGNNVLTTFTTTVRIPFGQTKPSVGDALFLGTVSGSVEGEIALKQLLATKREAGVACILITSVRDNARAEMPMRHYAATGA